MRDYFSTNVEAAAHYAAQHEDDYPDRDDRPTLRELMQEED